MVRFGLLSLLLASAASAADLYQTNSAAWPGGIAAGDTLHLYGTMTSAMTVGGSGTAGNPITIKLEDGAKFSAPTFGTASGAIDCNSQSYITIDGGLIENTQVGTGLTYSNNTRGLMAVGDHLTIQNLRMTNIWLAKQDPNGAGIGIYASGNCVTISNCNVAQAYSCIQYVPPGDDNITLSNVFIWHNTTRHSVHQIGVSVPTGLNSKLLNVDIGWNDCDVLEPWDLPPEDNTFHSDWLFFQSGNYDSSHFIKGMYIHNNTLGPAIGPHPTGAIWSGADGGTYQLRDVFIYNNLGTVTTQAWSNGFIQFGAASNVWVFNNTFIGSGSISAGGILAYVYNNIVPSGVGLSVATPDVSDAYHFPTSDQWTNVYVLTNYAVKEVKSDFNAVLPNAGFSLNGFCPTNAVVTWQSLSFDWDQWQQWNGNQWGECIYGGYKCGWFSTNINQLFFYAQTNSDPHSTTNAISFNPGTYVPADGDTTARGKGTNLTVVLASFGVSTTDFYGNARPAVGNWTIGAFEAQQSTPSTNTVSGPFSYGGRLLRSVGKQ